MRIKKYFWLLASVLLSFSCKRIDGLEILQQKIWLKNFRKRSLNSVGSSVYPMFKEFLNTDISISKNLNFRDSKNLILICVIRNDLERLKIFLGHYRKLGINKFAFLDDHSSDGTKEFLQSQNDIELFESKERFTTARKEAWINRILAYYGFERWYLVVDSDELLVYDNCENLFLTHIVTLLEKEKITAASGMMIDMYSKDKNSNREINTSIYDGVDYFDKAGYFQGEYSRFMPNPTGGMRYRSFGMQMYLGKTPLFYMDNRTIYHIHCLFPFEKNFQKIKCLALLHYKFLEGDFAKYKERIKRKAMYKGSEEYKAYMEKMNNGAINFYDEQVSEKFVNSNSLVKNGLIEKLEWEKYKGY